MGRETTQIDKGGNLIERVKAGILKAKVNTEVTGITTADSSYHPRVT